LVHFFAAKERTTLRNTSKCKNTKVSASSFREIASFVAMTRKIATKQSWQSSNPVNSDSDIHFFAAKERTTLRNTRIKKQEHYNKHRILKHHSFREIASFVAMTQ